MIADSSITLLLSAAQPPLGEDSPVDVAVRLGRETRVDELSLALARYLGSLAGDSCGEHPENGQALHCTRLGRLAANDCVLDTGLRSGDTIMLATGMRFTAKPRPGQTGDASREDVVDLVVHAGPQAGRRISLCPGLYVLGRDPKRSGEIVLNDPSVSRRHLEVKVESDAVRVSDLDSSNGFAVEGRTLASTVRLTFDEGAQIELGRSVISFRNIAPSAPGTGTIRDGATLFNRQPRIVEPYRAPRLELDPAPGEVTFGKLQLAGVFLPIAGGVSSAAVFGEWKLLLSTALSPATLLWTYIAEHRSGRRIFHRSMTQYKQRLDELSEELEQARASECAARRAASPDAVELATRALQIRPELWERRSIDEDFLSLRIGVADLPAEFSVETPSGDGGSLPEPSQQLLDAYRTVPMVPVRIDLPHVGSLGLIGPDHRVDGLGLWLALQAAVLHSPRELSIAAAIDPDQRVQWEWLKWLPHTRGESSPLAGSHLADNLSSTQDLLSRVAELISERDGASGKPQDRPSRSNTPALVLFLDEDLTDERGVADEIFERGPAVGVYTIWLGHLQRGLPGECRSIAALDQALARLTLIRIGDNERITDVAADAVEQDFALRIARAIASFRDTSARGKTTRSSVPRDPERTSPPSFRDGFLGAERSDGIAIAPFVWTDSIAMMRESPEQDRSKDRDMVLGLAPPWETPEG